MSPKEVGSKFYLFCVCNLNEGVSVSLCDGAEVGRFIYRWWPLLIFAWWLPFVTYENKTAMKGSRRGWYCRRSQTDWLKQASGHCRSIWETLLSSPRWRTSTTRCKLRIISVVRLKWEWKKGSVWVSLSPIHGPVLRPRAALRVTFTTEQVGQ